MILLFFILYKLYPRQTRSPETVYLAFTFGLIVIVFTSFGIEKLWSKYLNVKIVKSFLFPGAVIHELSHALLCLVTGTTIKELNIFKIENSGIQYDRPKVPYLFDFFITTSPIFGCAVILIVTSIILGNPIQVSESLPNEMTLSMKLVFDYAKNFLDMIWVTLNLFWKSGFQSISSILFIIASIIFTVSMAPHKSDIKYIVPGFIVLGTTLFFLEISGISLLDYKWWDQALQNSWKIVTYIISMLLTILFITSVIIGFIKGIKLTFGHKSG
ncbi:MAG: hypothetical protein K8F52_03350 [Candidatus Scalindua rubra]|uniref:Uncharacterized protein n=1 Tax=Candidatus Scalindua brodae TaxID=237368 RepID=A0A0B0EH03_9BACT|nr:MAG: hypothetical protein SCABRO_03865 [Candidatus Scalindua brodae]MBZ0107684.1 hypothetical protein [Candidatus Scalindua rubra]TWU35559.1 hypothetical protein S225a_09260 [Candidatus Brocadiaceae bacterium S225]